MRTTSLRPIWATCLLMMMAIACHATSVVFTFAVRDSTIGPGSENRKTGLTPAFTVFKKTSDATAPTGIYTVASPYVSAGLTAPTITEVGNGMYQFSYDPDAAGSEIIYEIDAADGSSTVLQSYSDRFIDGMIAYDSSRVTGAIATGTYKVTFGNTNIATLGGLTPPANWNLFSIDSNGRTLLQPMQPSVTIPNVTTVGTLTTLPAQPAWAFFSAAPTNWLTSGAFTTGTQAPAGFLTNEYAAIATHVGSIVIDGGLTLQQSQEIQLAMDFDAVRTYNETTHVATATWYRRTVVSGAIVADMTKPIVVKTTQYDTADKQILNSSTAINNANL